MLTADQVAAYQRDGFVKGEGLFSPDEVAALNEEMMWIIEEM